MVIRIIQPAQMSPFHSQIGRSETIKLVLLAAEGNCGVTGATPDGRPVPYRLSALLAVSGNLADTLRLKPSYLSIEFCVIFILRGYFSSNLSLNQTCGWG